MPIRKDQAVMAGPCPVGWYLPGALRVRVLALQVLLLLPVWLWKVLALSILGTIATSSLATLIEDLIVQFLAADIAP